MDMGREVSSIEHSYQQKTDISHLLTKVLPLCHSCFFQSVVVVVVEEVVQLHLFFFLAIDTCFFLIFLEKKKSKYLPMNIFNRI